MNHAIFDLDGVLIDSEDVWRQAYIDVVASRCGIELPRDVFPLMQGLRVREVVDQLHAIYDLPIERSVLVDGVVAMVVSRVDQAAPIEGSIDLLRRLHQDGVQPALASSSPEAVIEAELDRLNVARETFVYVGSAAELKYGKPHPEVYLRVSEAMGWDPTTCIVFEDSPAGVVAATAARMQCVGLAVPGSDVAHHAAFALCSSTVPSLDRIATSNFT